MPSVKKDIKEMKSLIRHKEKNISLEGVEIIGDEEFHRKYEEISREYQPKIDTFPRRSDGSLYHPLKEDLDYIAEMQNKLEEIVV